MIGGGLSQNSSHTKSGGPGTSKLNEADISLKDDFIDLKEKEKTENKID